MLAAEYADGLMISVKNPAEAYEKVINPSMQKSEELGKSKLRVHTYRWTMFADNDEDAWESLKSWRGLRAPFLAGREQNEKANPVGIQGGPEEGTRHAQLRGVETAASRERRRERARPSTKLPLERRRYAI